MKTRLGLTFAVIFVVLLVLYFGEVIGPGTGGSVAPPAPLQAGEELPGLAKSTPGVDIAKIGDGATASTGGGGTGESATIGESEELPPDLTRESEFSFEIIVTDQRGESLDAEITIFTKWIDFRPLGTLEKGVRTGYLPKEGEYAVEADFGGTQIAVPFTVSADAPVAKVEIRLPGSASISGQVYSDVGSITESTRAPFKVLGEEDVRVEAVPVDGDGEAVLYSRVNEAGRYEIKGLPAGDWFVRLKNHFYVARVSVGEKDHAIHDIRLMSGRISGRVLDEVSGEPAKEVQVVLQMTASDTIAPEMLKAAGFAKVSDRLAPDENGHYAFTNLPTGEYSMFSNGNAYGAGSATVTLTAEKNDEVVDFRLPRGSSVQLTIKDAAGHDVPQPICMTGGIMWGFTGRVTGLKAGTHDFLAGGVGHEVVIMKDVVFEQGVPTPLDFILAEEAATRVTFTDGAGHPIAGVRVSTPYQGVDLQAVLARFYRGQGGAMTKTGADGVVTIRGVRAGPCRVVAKRTGFALLDRPLKLPAGGGDLTVVLEAADTVFNYRVRITSVAPGSQAERVGIRIGDVIVSYSGEAVHGTDGFIAAVQSARAAGETAIEMVVESEGAKRTVTVGPGVLGINLAEFEE